MVFKVCKHLKTLKKHEYFTHNCRNHHTENLHYYTESSYIGYVDYIDYIGYIDYVCYIK